MNGNWRYVIIDDYVPCVEGKAKGEYKPAFLHGKIKEKVDFNSFLKFLELSDRRNLASAFAKSLCQMLFKLRKHH